MKHTWLCVIIYFVLAGNAQGQERKFSINVNALNLIASGPSVAINYDVSQRWNIQIYGSTGKFDVVGYSFKTGIVDFKYKLSENFYVGPYLRYIDKTVNYSGYVDHTGYVALPGRNFHGTGISSGISIGLNLVNNKRLNIESFMGGGYGKFIAQRGDTEGTGFVDVRIGLLTGVRF